MYCTTNKPWTAYSNIKIKTEKILPVDSLLHGIIRSQTKEHRKYPKYHRRYLHKQVESNRTWRYYNTPGTSCWGSGSPDRTSEWMLRIRLLSSVTIRMQKKNSIFFSYILPTGTLSSVFFMRKGKDLEPDRHPDRFLWLMDQDPGGLKTCGSPTLPGTRKFLKGPIYMDQWNSTPKYRYLSKYGTVRVYKNTPWWRGVYWPTGGLSGSTDTAWCGCCCSPPPSTSQQSAAREQTSRQGSSPFQLSLSSSQQTT